MRGQHIGDGLPYLLLVADIADMQRNAPRGRGLRGVDLRADLFEFFDLAARKRQAGAKARKLMRGAAANAAAAARDQHGAPGKQLAVKYGTILHACLRVQGFAVRPSRLTSLPWLS